MQRWAFFAELIRMPNARRTDVIKPVASIVPDDVPTLSDDECLARLQLALEEEDFDHLDEVARLIGRLAVTIE
jgi:hypothetical protein